MLKRKNKVSTKDINYMYKKQQTFYGKYFVIFVAKSKFQNCFGINIGLKISKSSVLRHKLKRIFFTKIDKNILEKKIFSGEQNYGKFFFLPSKKSIEKMNNLITLNQNFELEFSNWCEEDINYLLKKIDGIDKKI